LTTLLALLLALVSRGNVWQANVPMFEAPNLSRGIVYNVLRLGEVGDFQHISSFEAQMFVEPQNCHTKHCTANFAKPMLAVRCSFSVVLVIFILLEHIIGG
jgi:hypothetical protein